MALLVATWSRRTAHAQASQRDCVPTGPSPNGTTSQRDLVAVRRKTLYACATLRDIQAEGHSGGGRERVSDVPSVAGMASMPRPLGCPREGTIAAWELPASARRQHPPPLEDSRRAQCSSARVRGAAACRAYLGRPGCIEIGIFLRHRPSLRLTKPRNRDRVPRNRRDDTAKTDSVPLRVRAADRSSERVCSARIMAVSTAESMSALRVQGSRGSVCRHMSDKCFEPAQIFAVVRSGPGCDHWRLSKRAANSSLGRGSHAALTGELCRC